MESLLTLFLFLSCRQNDPGSSSGGPLGGDSGYTTSPLCNNHHHQLQAASEGPAEKKNSNLLVNVPTKDDLVEKNAITGVATRAVAPNANANQQGTLGRNGTLCKKVYL